MNSNRFDTWTRNRALRLSRRNALQLMGAGGAAATAAAFASNTLAQGPCRLIIHAETAAGPSTSVTYDGTLQFTLEEDGTFAQASFDGAQSVTGRVTGLAIDFELTFPGNEIVSFAGVGEQPLSFCEGVATGIFDGPQPGDLGGWEVTGSSPQSSFGSSPGGSQSTSESNSTTGGSSSSTGGEGSTTDCPPPQTACGPNCCPGFGACIDANQGLCACPVGAIPCGSNCVQDCFENEFMNLDTCECELTQGPTCVELMGGCGADGDCCSGMCLTGVCVDHICEGGNPAYCPGFGCVDLFTDRNNCGYCGNVTCAGLNMQCVQGACA